MQLRHGNVEFGVVGVVNTHEFRRTFVASERLKPHIAPHAVIKMHDGVAGFKFRNITDHRLNARRGILDARAALDGSDVVKFVFGDKRNGGGFGFKAFGRRPHGHHQRRRTFQKRREVAGTSHLEVVLREHFLNARSAARARRAD